MMTCFIHKGYFCNHIPRPCRRRVTLYSQGIYYFQLMRIDCSDGRLAGYDEQWQETWMLSRESKIPVVKAVDTICNYSK